MHEVFDRSGALVGSIDDTGVVHDPQGRRAGAYNPFTRQVRDAAGAVAGQVHADGYLYGLNGELLGTVTADNDDVRNGFGTRVGRVTRGNGSAPPPSGTPASRELPQRGAAALLLLCRPDPPARDLGTLLQRLRKGQVPMYFVERLTLWGLFALFAIVWLFGAQVVSLLRGHGDPVAALAGLGVAVIFIVLFVREIRTMMK